MADTNTYTSKQKTEKWTSRDKFKALDLTDVPIGTEYNLTGNIELEDLDSSIQNSIKNAATKTELKDYYILTGGTSVAANVSLDTILTPGVYDLQPGNSSFPSEAKSPSKMVVERYYNSNDGLTPMIMQTFYNYTEEIGGSYEAAGGCYHRTHYSDQWYEWHKVATTAYVDEKVAVVEFVQPVDKDNIGNILALTDEQYNKLFNTKTAFIVYGNDIYRKTISGDEYNGMMFESVSGIFDYSADLYLTTAYMSDDDYASQKISVGSVDGLSLGLPVSFYTPSNVAIEGLSNRRITSIDSTNKKITVDGGFIGSSLRLAEGSLLKVPTTSTGKKLTNTIINGSDETNIINVDETRSLTVGMAISFHVPSGGLMAGGTGRIITAIDTANKTITVSGSALDSDMVSQGTYITLYQTKPTKGKLKVLYQNMSFSKYLSFSEINIEKPKDKDALSVTIYEAGD